MVVGGRLDLPPDLPTGIGNGVCVGIDPPSRIACAIAAKVAPHKVSTMFALVTVALLIHLPSTSQPRSWNPARKMMIGPFTPRGAQ